MRSFALVLGTALCIATAAHAVQPSEILTDPTQESRARALSKELRCMVCQNQSIDDSDAPLARDLRILVRERIAAGDSDSAVRDFMVARYGAFVLLKPPVNAQTLLLWLLAPATLLIGAFLIFRRTRKVSPSVSEALSADDEARIAALTSDVPSKRANVTKD